MRLGLSMYGKAIEDAMIGLVVFCCIGGVAVGALAMWIIPLVWAWIKPILHMWTA